MKITAIIQQVKNPDRASIFIDGKYSFSLTLNELVGEKLKISQDIEEPALRRLKKMSEDGKLRARALEWVLNRPRSQREFKDYMFRKKADPDIAGRLLQDFTEKRYLDETRYAEWLADLRRRKGKSERAIRSELAGKGIDREVVAETLADGDDELERLRALVAKKGQLPRYKADPQKFMQYLARQGFAYEDIKRIFTANADS